MGRFQRSRRQDQFNQKEETRLRYFKNLPLSLLLLCLALFSSGCGSGGDDFVHTGFNPDTPQINEYVLREEVRVLPSDGSLVIEEITDDTVCFSGEVPDFAVGEVLIQNTGPQQFGRKVVSVQQSDGKTVVQTGPISLVDVFAEANIQISERVPAEVLRQLEPALPGVTIGEPFLAQGSDVVNNNFTVPVNFQNVLLGEDGDANQVLANGTIYITVGIERALQIDNFAQLRRVRLVPYFEAEGQLDLKASGGLTFRNKVPITHTLSFPVGAIGPLPLDAGLKLVIDVDGRIAGRGSLTVNGQVEASGGVDFDGSQWTVPTHFDYDFNIEPPDLRGEVDLSVSVVNPEMSLNLVGIGEAYVNSALMRANAAFAFRALPEPAWVFNTSTNYSVTAGVNLNLGPINLFSGELPRFNTPKIPLGPELVIPVVTMPPVPATSLVITPGSKTLNVNEKTVLTAFLVEDQSGLGVPTPVEWSSSNPGAVSIVANGPTATITALQGGGAATIRANFLGKTATAQVDIRQPSLQQLTIEPSNPRVMASSDLQLAVKARYSDGRVFDLTHIAEFSTSDTQVLRVNSGGRVTGVKAGEGVVKATVRDQSVEQSVEVFARRYSRQAVKLPSDFDGQLDVGESVELLAIAYYLDGSHRFNESQLDWTSSNPDAITVDDEGRITGVGGGTSTITGVLPGTGLSGAVTLRVARPPILSLVISPSSPNVLVGDTIDFTVTANYADGTSSNVTSQVLLTDFWGYAVEFSSSIPGRAVAVSRGSDLILAKFREPQSPLGLAEVRVDGPSRLNTLQAPSDIGTSVPFDLLTEVLLGSGLRSPIDVPVNVRLRSGGAVLSGPTNGNTTGGTITLAGLAINQPGQYELLLDSIHLSMKST